MTPQQRKRMERRDELNHRRTELAKQISTGEKSLLATDDDRTRQSLNEKLTAMRNEFHSLNLELARGFHEPFSEFQLRMNCEHIQLGRGDAYSEGGRLMGTGGYLFANGALSDGEKSHSEPPVDRVAQLRLRKHFIETKLKREVAAFDQFKAACEQQAGYHAANPMTCPSPPANATDQLRAGKARVESLRNELDALKIEMNQLPGPRALAAFQENQRQLQSTAKQHLAEIISIQI